MSKKIVKKIRESVDYLLQKKISAPLETQKVIDFLLEATFFDKDDDFFQKIVQAEGCDAEKYKFFNGKRYTKQEDGHYRGYHGKIFASRRLEILQWKNSDWLCYSSQRRQS